MQATYNRRAIMLKAWETVRKADRTRFSLPLLLSRALRSAWAEARNALAMAEYVTHRAKPQTQADRIRAAMRDLENKDRWTRADYARMDALRADLMTAFEHEAASEDYAEKRALIAASGGRFCAVTFTKADGSERTMKVQPATLAKHIKGDAVSEAGKRATLTRKARHPHLLPVWDAEAHAPRSVNLATVSRIAVGGQVHEYRAQS